MLGAYILAGWLGWLWVVNAWLTKAIDMLLVSCILAQLITCFFVVLDYCLSLIGVYIELHMGYNVDWKLTVLF